MTEKHPSEPAISLTPQEWEELERETAWVEGLRREHDSKYGSRLRAAISDAACEPAKSRLVDRLLKLSFPYRMMIEQRQSAAPLKGSKDEPERPGIEGYYRHLKRQTGSLVTALLDVRMDDPLAHFTWGAGTEQVKHALHRQAILRVSIAEQLSELLEHNQTILDFLQSPAEMGATPVSAAEHSYSLSHMVCHFLHYYGCTPRSTKGGVLHRTLKALDIDSTGALKKGYEKWKADQKETSLNN